MAYHSFIYSDRVIKAVLTFDRTMAFRAKIDLALTVIIRDLQIVVMTTTSMRTQTPDQTIDEGSSFIDGLLKYS
jgi:hypothetical protein